jgi:hypothetical protein
MEDVNSGKRFADTGAEGQTEEYLDSMCRGIAGEINRPGVEGESSELGLQAADSVVNIRILEKNPPSEDSIYKELDDARLEAARRNLVKTMEIQVSNEAKHGTRASEAFKATYESVSGLFVETNHLVVIDMIRKEQQIQQLETNKRTNPPRNLGKME